MNICNYLSIKRKKNTLRCQHVASWFAFSVKHVRGGLLLLCCPCTYISYYAKIKK